ncbi:uroporphyrinogen decarboxylase family protein [Geminisphaera colitermitum]|uniref:uroporphyrinogen decarboxylase family protein n=1 Tax=Geminisphaera colitermitum TaxID=1148786 RepID=UPI000158CCF0|nr:uroporphyrinogen decarboxylase family protein [Geminisphaera colitermitum]
MTNIPDCNTAAAGDRLAGFDFSSHNDEIRPLWAALDAGCVPSRIPVILGTNTRYFMFDPAANPAGIDFRLYSENPDIMFDTQLRFQRWSKFNLLQDRELGLPAEWLLTPDFQNYYEAAWFGCQIHYFPGQVPDTLPDFADAPERVMEHGLPDLFGGLMARALEYSEHFQTRAARETFLGRPIKTAEPFLTTDGPMTVACNLFGPSFVCETMLDDPERLRRLLDFITEATIQRCVAWRKRAGILVPCDKGFGFADDSIAMISTAAYREHILPHHRRLCDALATPAPRGIHLCGDSTRHFPILQKELNIQSFDTGFPVNFGALRRELGPQVLIQGGPHVQLLHQSTPEQVREAVRDILQSGILDGGRFVLREGNNLAPGTPLDNTEAMYHAGLEWGRGGGQAADFSGAGGTPASRDFGFSISD